MMKANHEARRVLVNGNQVLVERGQLLTSEVKLAETWRWDRGTVRRFENVLENDQMLIRNATTHYTVLTIVNYEFFQGDTTADAAPETTPDTTPETTQTRIKELKNTSLYKSPEEIYQKHPRYDEDQYKTIRDYWEAIRSTRKSGKIALSIVAAEMEYWERFPVEIVIESLQIHLAKNRDKPEEYTRGIMRRKANENQNGGNHGQDTGNSGTAQIQNPPAYNRSKFLFKPSTGA